MKFHQSYAWFLLAVLGALGRAADAPAQPASPDWPQWGGPSGDFKLSTVKLADEWSDAGPPRLWDRPLGEGYSPVSADGSRLFTMYRQGDDEVIVALDPKTGADLWQHRCRTDPYPQQTAEFGQGPSATPLVIGDRLIAVGFTGFVHCLDRVSGTPRWSLDLVRDLGGKIHYYGYANSVIAHRGLALMLVGGDRYGVIAVDPEDGRVVWKSKPYDTSYASPVIINVDGQDQLVFFTTDQVVGIDAANGEHLWDHSVANHCGTNCTSAVWGPDNLLWAATKGVGGTRMLRLSRRDGASRAEQVWDSRKIRLYHWNAQRIGDYVVASSGGSTQFLSVIDAKTGEFKERLRGFGSVNSIQVADKLILLDSDGQLALATLSDGGIEIISKTQVRETVTWTPPTLVGTQLIIRDRERIAAFDVG